MKLIITDVEVPNISVNGDYKIITPNSNISNCVGCFGCWVKTPGICVLKDGYDNMGISMGNCDEMIIISECCYGSVSPFVKTVQDRAISYFHADFEIRNDMMRDKVRYDNTITLSAYFYGKDISTKEKETAIEIIKANAENYKGHIGNICFMNTIRDIEEISL